MTVKAGDKLQFPGCPEAVVTRVDIDPIFGDSYVHYYYPEFRDLRGTTQSTTLETAEKHLVKDEYPYGEPFPTGSVVQFKRTRYVVDGFDGEHHNLTPEDGDVEGRLYFSPDFFELVQPPFPSLHEVWEDRNGVRYYVRSVNEDDNNVRISRFDGPDIIITVQQLHAGYTKLL